MSEFTLTVAKAAICAAASFLAGKAFDSATKDAAKTESKDFD